jgi:RHS repeat-associated protein
MFTGREYAQRFGIYEYRARAYHPGLGRFTSEDPMGYAAGDYNLFRYCHNDPENLTDAMGLTSATPQDVSSLQNNEPARLAATEKRFEVNATTASTVERAGGNMTYATNGGWGVLASSIRGTSSGNFNDKNMNNHYVPTSDKRLNGKGGRTVANVSVVANTDGTITVNHDINWWVDRQYAGTDVVTREIQHVTHWRAWQYDGEGHDEIIDFQRGGQNGGADALQARLQNRHSIEYRSQRSQFDWPSGRPHDLSTHPPRPVTEQDIQNALSTIH